MRDFSLQKLQELLTAFRDKQYTLIRFDRYWDERELYDKRDKVILLRHDVDRWPGRALAVAEMEAKNNIRGTYFFRVKPGIFNPGIIKKIADCGHEIGYHYECMSDAGGDWEKARVLFEKGLNQLRGIVPVVSVSMHGNVLSSQDNRFFFKRHTLEEFRLKGAAYLSLDFSRFFYLADSGRDWSAQRRVIWDQVAGGQDGFMPGRSTSSLVDAIRQERINNAQLLIHPNRWPATRGAWVCQFLEDNAINMLKGFILSCRKVTRVPEDFQIGGGEGENVNKKMSKNVIILYSPGLGSFVLYSRFIRSYPHLIKCIVAFPNVAISPKASRGRVFVQILHVIRKSAPSYILFHGLTKSFYNLLATLFRTRLKDIARSAGVPVRSYRSMDERFLEDMKSLQSDFIFNNTPNILTKEIIATAGQGVINFHGAPLPAYRGAGNYFWLLFNGEPRSRGTWHYVNEQLDAGDIIISTEDIVIEERMTVFQLWLQTRLKAHDGLKGFVPYFLDRQRIPATPQDDREVSVRSFPGPEVSRGVRQKGHAVADGKDFLQIIRLAKTGHVD